MGVDKNLSSIRLSKSNSVDLYRPPALRNCNQSSAQAAVPTTTTIVRSTSTITANISTPLPNTAAAPDENERISASAAMIGSCGGIDDDKAIQMSSQTQITSTMTEATIATNTTNTATRRERRPDRAVYIPRARRSQTTPPTTTVPSAVYSTQIEKPQPNRAKAQPAPTTTTTTTTTNAPVTGSTSAKADERSSNDSGKSSTAAKAKSKATTPAVTVSNISNRERKEVRSKRTEARTTSEVESIGDIGDISATGTDCCDSGCDDQQQPTSVTSSENMKNSQVANAIAEGGLYQLANDATTHNLLIEDVVVVGSGVAGNGDNARVISAAVKCDIDEQELKRASKEINRSNRRIMKQTFDSDVLEIPEKIEQEHQAVPASNDLIPQRAANSVLLDGNSSTEDDDEDEDDEDDWENMYDESGECLNPKIMEELTAAVGKVKIELPKMDYTAYLTKQSILNEEEFPHVLEVSNFPVEFKNQDLLMVFSQYKESGFDIKWVDDTHALAVFSSSRIAAEVLTMGHPFVVLKPLADATVESRLKAKKCANSLQPYRPRPETCAALARRLVTGALGVRLKTAAAERENEKRVLREAKERKLLAAKQHDEIWDK